MPEETTIEVVSLARKMCSDCVNFDDCAAWSLVQTIETAAIVGGLLPTERAALRRSGVFESVGYTFKGQKWIQNDHLPEEAPPVDATIGQQDPADV